MTTPGTLSRIPAAVLAHQGGWDEILLVAGPILVIVGLIVVAQRRARQSSTDSIDAPSDESRPTRSS